MKRAWIAVAIVAAAGVALWISSRTPPSGVDAADTRAALDSPATSQTAVTADGINAARQELPTSSFGGTMPESGRLRVTVTEAGTPCFEPVNVTVTSESAGFAQTPVRGQANFSVPIDATWTISGDLGPRKFSREGTVAGPSRAGEIVDVELELPVLPRISMTLLDPLGNVLANTVIYAKCRSTEGAESASDLQLTTEDDGRATIVWPTTIERPVLTLESPNITPRWRRLEPELPAPLPAGRTDLGTLRFVELKLIVAGRVVDSAGKAMADVLTELEASTDAPAGVERRGPVWLPLDTVWTARDGRFAYYGPESVAEPTAPLRITVWLEGSRVVATEPFAPGTRDLQIALP